MSFNHAVLEAVVEGLRAQDQDVVVRDLYQLGFSPILRSVDLARMAAGQMPDDIKAEQDQVRAADCLTFIFPIWWTGMPAMLKGYIDRVFSMGFAFALEPQGARALLTDKKAMIFNTTAFPQALYQNSGLAESLDANLEGGILRFCGLQVLLHKYFWGVPFSSAEERQQMLADIPGLVQAGGRP
jgi:NAD(P)H dehydrogenase (quinone)